MLKDIYTQTDKTKEQVDKLHSFFEKTNNIILLLYYKNYDNTSNSFSYPLINFYIENIKFIEKINELIEIYNGTDKKFLEKIKQLYIKEHPVEEQSVGGKIRIKKVIRRYK